MSKNLQKKFNAIEEKVVISDFKITRVDVGWFPTLGFKKEGVCDSKLRL